MLRQSLICSPKLRRNISALFQSGDKARENFVLSPFLNIDERLKNIGEIEENIKRRGLTTDLNELRNEHVLLKDINDRKKAIEDRRKQIHQQFKEAPSEGLKIQAKQLNTDFKLLRDNSYHLEDNFVHRFLNLPNFIHKNTPDSEKKVIHSFKESAKLNEPKSDLSSENELIEFYDPACYYMKNEAAKFDLFMPMQVMSNYQDKGFLSFSNPDFTRSIIAEAAGIDTKDLFLLHEDEVEQKLNLLHLTGSASFLNFLPYFAKLSIYPNLFPLRYISSGKQYDARNHFDHQNLYNVVQSTCCQTFIATVDGSSSDDIMNEQIKRFIETFEVFEQHFRIVYHPADKLTRAESCKIGVEMFSPSSNDYIEVANFSYYGNYISHRLLFNYRTGKDINYPHIYLGTAVNVTKLLMILIENSEDFKCSPSINAF